MKKTIEMNAEHVNKSREEKIDIFNTAFKKMAKKYGIAINVYLKGSYEETGTGDILHIIDPFKSILASLVMSFVFGMFMNAFSINFWFNFFEISKQINWFGAGFLACVPFLGRFTLPLWFITLVLSFCF